MTAADDIRRAWLEGVEAEAARIARGDYTPTDTPPPTYAQRAAEDRAAAYGEFLAEERAWASDRDMDRAAGVWENRFENQARWSR